MNVFWILAAAIVVTALGNAMRKVTYQRRARRDAGEPTAGTSKLYDGTGLVFVVGGACVMAVAVFTIGVGDPVAFYHEIF